MDREEVVGGVGDLSDFSGGCEGSAARIFVVRAGRRAYGCALYLHVTVPASITSTASYIVNHQLASYLPSPRPRSARSLSLARNLARVPDLASLPLPPPLPSTNTSSSLLERPSSIHRPLQTSKESSRRDGRTQILRWRCVRLAWLLRSGDDVEASHPPLAHDRPRASRTASQIVSSDDGAAPEIRP